MTDTALVPLAETMQLGEVLARSGFFKDGRDASQAVVKVLAGRELGFGPVASMTGIYIVEGKVSIGANLMAAAVKRSKKYNYRVTVMDNTACSIDFYEGGEKIGVSTFTIHDAQAAGVAGKSVWKQYPKNMLFARAMSNGVRWFCPDIFGGAPVYDPEELGATVNGETGEVIDVQSRIVVEPAATAPTNGNSGKQTLAAFPTPATDGLPFPMTEKGAVDWAMQAAPEVWPVGNDGYIVRDVVKRSFENVRKTGVTGEELGRAWIAKVAAKKDDRAKSEAIRLSDAELDGTEQPQF